MSSEAASGSACRPSWNPLKCGGADLPANLTILVKTLAIVLLMTNHVRLLPDPWLSFIPAIDLIPAAPFQRTLQTVFVLAAVAIVFNRRIRFFSLVLGSTMLLAVVSSKAYYGNNKTFCGLMFLLSGLYKPGGYPFLRWQLAITYFGAGLNKLLDGDWHTGVFFENWAVHRLHQPWYIALDDWLPPLVLAKFMCWTTILTELGIVPFLLLPRLYPWAIVLNILFQASLLLFTGTTFTLFFYSMTAASLAFVHWPETALSVTYRPDRPLGRWACAFLQPWDFDRRFTFLPLPPAAGEEEPRLPSPVTLRFSLGDRIYSNFRAVRMIVLLNPVTYFVLAGAIAACEAAPLAALLRRIIVAASLALLLPPLAWIADTLSGSGDLRPAQMAPPPASDQMTEA